jgi:ABC-type Zn uptake system ZnuABC Zn-binding protein ZnuA
MLVLPRSTLLLRNTEYVILHRIRYKTFNTPGISYVTVTKKKTVRTFLTSIIASLILVLFSSNSTTNAEYPLNSVLPSTMLNRSTVRCVGLNSSSVEEVNFIIASTTSDSQKLDVVTSVSPITNIVKNVGGNRIDLTGLVPEGVNSHTFELVPSDVVKVNNADLVIIDGLGLETNVEEVAQGAQNKNPKLQILTLGDNTITPSQWVFDFSFPKEEGDPNPHLWLNVAYAMKFANLTRDKLIDMDSRNTQYYSVNTDRYISILKNLDDGIMQAVQTVPAENRKLLTYHDSWAYFAARYNMTVMGAVQPSDFGEPTPQEVARLIDQIRSEKVPAIFASEVFPTEVVDQIANEGNVEIVETLSDDDLPGNPGDPNHSYVGMMLENMKNMLVPLGGKIAALSDVDPRDMYSPS